MNFRDTWKGKVLLMIKMMRLIQICTYNSTLELSLIFGGLDHIIKQEPNLHPCGVLGVFQVFQYG